MTSSKREGTQRDQSVQTYKPFDPMCEPGLVSVLFLSCGKHALASVSLASTAAAVRQYGEEVEWCLLEQGEGDEAEANLAMFRDFDAERKVIVRPDVNYGINSAMNTLWAISRGEYCMHHENDWINRQPSFDFLKVAKDILDERSEVGIVQLRAIWDPNENWGLHKPEYSPWSCDHIANKVFQEQTKSGHTFLICEFPNGWSNNPCLVRKKLFRECGPLPEPPLTADPRHGETVMQNRVADSGCAIAHIHHEIYFHGGGAARRFYESGVK